MILKYCCGTPISSNLLYIGAGGLITNESCINHHLSALFYMHMLTVLWPPKSRPDMFMNQSAWIKLLLRAGRPTTSGATGHCASVCGHWCMYACGLGESSWIHHIVFVCTQLYPGAILEVCGWKLGRFPQVQGEITLGTLIFIIWISFVIQKQPFSDTELMLRESLWTEVRVKQPLDITFCSWWSQTPGVQGGGLIQLG